MIKHSIEKQSKSGWILDSVEDILKPILSPRQPIEMVELSFSSLLEKEKEFALHWLKVISVSNIELAYVFAIEVGAARKELDMEGVEAWLSKSLSVYDREGLYPSVTVLRELEAFKQEYIKQAYTCRLEEVKPLLDVYIRGLAGRALELKPAGDVYTDTEHLFLPESISQYKDKKKNALLYKSMACFLWAQTWYGTFKKRDYLATSTNSRLEAYDDPELAKRTFLTLENIRLLSAIKRDLPGLHREMSTLSPLMLPAEKTWRVIAKRLEKKNSTVEDSFEALDKLMSLSLIFPVTEYQGQLNLLEIEARIEDRKNKLLESVNDLKQKGAISDQQIEDALASFNAAESKKQQDTDSKQDEGDDSNMMAGPEGLESEQLKLLLASLLQDVEQLDQGMFDQCGGGTAGDEAFSEKESEHPDLWEQQSGDSFYIDEWDYLRQNYRKGWCHVRHRSIDETDHGFKQKTEEKYPYLTSRVRKIFEAMRDLPRYANRQTDGEEFDLDALIDMRTASVAGEELSERLYIRRLNNERSVSVCLLVDMSGSTKGWINLAMREALILFSEALNTLGDQYAIYGFSGLTRQRCEIYDVKDFSDQRREKISNRIGNIQAKDYTRMGFAIRYATRCLLKTDSRHKILLILSDGKPDDYDGYQGEYGIQDTRQAILEAQGHSINPYSITIDKYAQSYLPRLFGPGQYMILNDVSNLPLKLSEVYRKLSM